MKASVSVVSKQFYAMNSTKNQQLKGIAQTADTVVVNAEKTSAISLRELWVYRELLYFLVWRQIIIRYKQTAVGIIWVVMQPVVSMLVMTIVFNQFLEVESPEAPYPIFVFSGLLFWRYFSTSMLQSGQSLVNNAHMISKIYFPRIIMPVASCLSTVVDFLVGFAVLLVMFPFFGTALSFKLLLVPVLLIVTLLTTLSVSLWLSALNVRYRDINQIIPFIIQVWMYMVPLMYPIETVPESVRTIYSINPMVGVIEGARWALIGTSAPDVTTLLIGTVTVLVLLVGGFIFFHRVERNFADVI